jgi:elongation factor P--(R)-beta-lysine ligase
MTGWKTRVTIETLSGRAELLKAIRAYFNHHKVLEVTTPTLGTRGVTDSQIQNIELVQQGRSYYLQTSPEYAMKRLLASTGTPIYQICPAYRGSELGANHNMEFTMLEWYRPGFTLRDLMEDVENLLIAVVAALSSISPIAKEFSFAHLPQVAYRELFEKVFSINPHSATLGELTTLVESRGIECSHITNHLDEGTRSDYLDILFSTVIEPTLKQPTIVFDYPACQVALAQLAEVDGFQVASRFELFARGLELANGYFELGNSVELKARMEANNVLRTTRNLPLIAPDEKLLASLEYMPECSGIALGVDRLLMILLGKSSLADVVTFTSDCI